MRVRGAVFSAGLVVLAVSVSGCEHATGAPPGGGAPAMPPALVTAAVVESVTMPVVLDAMGRCTAFEAVLVQPRVTGAITAIHFKDGAELHAGDPLFTIDPRPYQATLDHAAAVVSQMTAQLSLARVELGRMENLLRSNAVSRQDHDARQNAVEVMEAQLQSSKATQASAALDVEFCTVRSPIEGRAGKRLVDLGALVVANSGATLVTIQRHDPIYADFTVSERDLDAVRRGLVERSLRAFARVPGGVEREGAVTFLDNAVQDATGTIQLRAQLGNEDRVFWPGQFVQVRLVLRDQPGARVVPASAIQIGQQGNFVYVIKSDASVELRTIVPGQRHGDRVVVASGLEPGERVVVTGQLMLFPGAKVNVAPVATASGPEAAR